METRQKRLLRYLNDSYAAEVGALVALKDLAMITNDERVRAVAEDHYRVTQSQAERLRQRILALGGDKSEPKAAMNTVIAKGSSLTNMFHDREDKQTQDLIKSYALEHFEIGAYTSLSSYARSIGDFETALLADEIRAEEEQAAERMRALIPQVASMAAMNTREVQGRDYDARGNNWLSGLSLGTLVLPGAVLAIWGISRYMEHNRQQVGNSFATAPVAPVHTVPTPVVVETTVPVTSGHAREYSQDRDYTNYSGEMASKPDEPLSMTDQPYRP